MLIYIISIDILFSLSPARSSPADAHPGGTPGAVFSDTHPHTRAVFPKTAHRPVRFPFLFRRKTDTDAKKHHIPALFLSTHTNPGWTHRNLSISPPRINLVTQFSGVFHCDSFVFAFCMVFHSTIIIYLLQDFFALLLHVLSLPVSVISFLIHSFPCFLCVFLHTCPFFLFCFVLLLFCFCQSIDSN